MRIRGMLSTSNFLNIDHNAEFRFERFSMGAPRAATKG